VALLVEAVRNETNRNMAVPTDSFSVKSTLSGLNVTVEYSFFWEDFAKAENDKILVSDVFQVKDFFLRLYGDGEIYVTYPSQYFVETASPMPYERNESTRTLKWLRTKDLTNGLPIIVLKNGPPSTDFLVVLQQNPGAIGGLILAVVGIAAVFYVFKRRREGTARTAKPSLIASDLHIESDEEVIVKLLRSSGGKMYQSAVTEQCRFSKAKTSQLLSALERRGIVSRYKKGRDKIVVLAEEGKSEKQ
jgi:uncharacterized membrane protein